MTYSAATQLHTGEISAAGLNGEYAYGYICNNTAYQPLTNTGAGSFISRVGQTPFGGGGGTDTGGNNNNTNNQNQTQIPNQTITYTYDVYPTKIGLKLQAGTKDYIDSISLTGKGNVVTLVATTDCEALDESCAWVKFLVKKGDNLYESYDRLNVYLSDKTDVLYSINIPANTPDGLYKSYIVLSDDNNNIKRVPIELTVQKASWSSFLDKKLFPFRGSKFWQPFYVTVLDVLFVIGGMIGVGGLYQIFSHIFGKRKYHRRTGGHG